MNILLAFILNFCFSIFEFIGGIVTNSISILSDSIHDLSDALTILLSYFLEKKSKREPDLKYTYGYIRYSVLGGLITTIILIISSIFLIYNAIKRILNPVLIDYDGMLVLAIIGVLVNLISIFVTRKGTSLNQKAVNLHMLEDFFGWIVVLIGSIVIKFTNLSIIDPILSILVSLFIFLNAIKNLKTIINLFLEKTPDNVDISFVKKQLLKIDNVVDIHHIHVWSIDGYNNYATLHVIIDKDIKVKENIRKELLKYNIIHVTIELDSKDEICIHQECVIPDVKKHHH